MKYFFWIALMVLPSLAYSGQERDGSWSREFGRKVLEAARQDLLIRLQGDLRSKERPFFRSFGNEELVRLVQTLREANSEEERAINPPGQEQLSRQFYYSKTGERTILVLEPFFGGYKTLDIDTLPRLRAEEQLYQVQSLILREISHYDGVSGNEESLEKAREILAALGKNGHISSAQSLSCVLVITEIMEKKTWNVVRTVFQYGCTDGDILTWRVEGPKDRGEVTSRLARKKGIPFLRCQGAQLMQHTPKPYLVVYDSKCYFGKD